MNPSIFKAYDIRGKYPSEINEPVISEIISKFLSRKIKNLRPRRISLGLKKSPPKADPPRAEKLKVVIAHDTRLSSPSLYKNILNSLKTKTYNLKPIPAGMATTPMLYFLVNKLNADFGIMITASHNPKEYNGLKIVGKNAVPISGNEIQKLVIDN